MRYFFTGGYSSNAEDTLFVYLTDMKWLSIIFFNFFVLASTFSQKHDELWLLGYGSNPINTIYGGTVIDFSVTPPDMYYEFRPMRFRQANASMCDTAGNLLFYTNGIYIANALHEPMENGTGLAAGPAGAHNQGLYGYILDQGVMALPWPGHDSLYCIILMDKELTPSQNSFQSSNLYFTEVNMNENNGLGTVTKINQVLITDALHKGKVTATRHANGRDWWLLIRRYGSNQYYRIHFDDKGLLIRGIQNIGELIPSNSIGQAVFSPDGTKYANVHIAGSAGDPIYVSIYDFDRCSGELSNPAQFTYADTAWAGGIAISPNSRFLYVSSFRYVYQYDLEADDIESSRITVAEWDGFYDEHPNFPTTFYLAQLGPDGKIYINSSSSTRYLHVIDQPDSLGLACGLCQHCVELPTKNSFSMPNFPNYRLGHLEGSACDTLRQPPVAAWRYEPGGLSVAFEDESYHDIRSWRWDFGDGATDSLPAPVHEYAAAGAYEVCLAVSNPRGSGTLCQVVEVVPSSSREAVAGRRLWAAPNPARDQVSIALEPPLPQGGRWSLRDLQGRPLRSGALPLGQPLLMLDLAGLPGGVYVFELALPDGRRLVEKVVVVR
jgi:hypothetical protein